MTESPDTVPTGPPGSPERIDELLSARLDGEFAGAIADLAPTAVELEALDAAPGADRAGALAAAAARLRDVEPLDQLTRARLVHAALAADAPQGDTADLTPIKTTWRRGRLAPFGAVAAAVALVAGVAFAIGGPLDASNDNLAESSDAPGASAATDLGALIDLGSIDDPAQLRDLLSAEPMTDSARPELGVDGAPAVSTTAASTRSAEESTAALDDAAQYADNTVTDATSAAGSDPTVCLAGLNPGGPPPVLIGTAVFQGTPAFVATLDGETRTQAWVFGADCTLLNFQSLER